MKPEANKSYDTSQIISIIRDNFKDEERMILIKTQSGFDTACCYKPYEEGYACDSAVEIIHRLKEDIGCKDKWFIHIGRDIQYA